jgi:Ca2+-binding EF-hand superfamily protein
MKRFVFKCFDSNGGGKLSEHDLFKVMKSLSPQIHFQQSFVQNPEVLKR